MADHRPIDPAEGAVAPSVGATAGTLSSILLEAGGSFPSQIDNLAGSAHLEKSWLSYHRNQNLLSVKGC